MNTDMIANISNFGERLKELRMQKDLSQAELGKKIGVQPTHIGRYERGETLPTANALSILAKALNVSIDYLLHGITENAVTTEFEDSEFLTMFKESEQLPQDEKEIIKRFLGAFLNNKKIQKLAS